MVNQYLDILKLLPDNLKFSLEFVKLYLTIFIPYKSDMD